MGRDLNSPWFRGTRETPEPLWNPGRFTNYIARSLQEAGGFRSRLHAQIR